MFKYVLIDQYGYEWGIFTDISLIKPFISLLNGLHREITVVPICETGGLSCQKSL